jgi:hypothetical protein
MARLNNLASLAVNNDYSQLANQWKILSDTITTPNSSATNFANITALAASKNEPNILYFGTDNSEMYRVDQANVGDPHFIKLDTALATKLLPAGGYVSGIAVDPDSAKNVLICYSNYNIMSLFYSTDYGNTWYFVGGNLESGSNPSGGDPSIRSVRIFVDASGKRTYFAGTSIGLFSTDTLVLATQGGALTNTTKWKQESPDKIGAAVVTDIKTRRSDGYLAVATHGNGIFESYYKGNAPKIVQTYPEVTLYPNPASDKVYMVFDATSSTTYHTEVYDISGRRMAELSNGINNNNVLTQVLDVSDFPNGHYFVAYYNSMQQKQVKHFIVHH